ncbi:hypothetical protein QR680_005811 [Steinernema hermaphroditum]|uniref:Uncharacterized protein n=1 Tax=Steinernema hermaphroditum TaxID=289476 RepID=A0AA39HVR8_9BILA|nr:hypothetical protein QR680_005811 [Steinernema hermaphroditum]
MLNQHKITSTPRAIPKFTPGKSAEKLKSKPEVEKKKKEAPEKPKPPEQQKDENEEAETIINVIRRDVDSSIAESEKRIRRARKTSLACLIIFVFLSIGLFVGSIYLGTRSATAKKAFLDRVSNCTFRYEHAICLDGLCGNSSLLLFGSSCNNLLGSEKSEVTCNTGRTCGKKTVNCPNGAQLVVPTNDGGIAFYANQQKIGYSVGGT